MPTPHRGVKKIKWVHTHEALQSSACQAAHSPLVYVSKHHPHYDGWAHRHLWSVTTLVLITQRQSLPSPFWLPNLTIANGKGYVSGFWLSGRVYMRIWSSNEPSNQVSSVCMSPPVNWWLPRNPSNGALDWPLEYLCPAWNVSSIAFWGRNTHNASGAQCPLSCRPPSTVSGQLLAIGKSSFNHSWITIALNISKTTLFFLFFSLWRKKNYTSQRRSYTNCFKVIYWCEI